ncbi:hypothetical protein MJ257_23185 [Paenibacillus timonensis]|uniref:Uncharacterized protein n=1 Tax=Paenibacillus timonensis TaxID=225915 RepID=A0ABW3SHT0_9BACL|nr:MULTISPECIES: hypothetical protein [Paenibacillus]MCH1643009.1 hypothetical protein [Paenibacillus timonensis]MDU2242397.1 hypothetical protein [Paenibacillus sp.]
MEKGSWSRPVSPAELQEAKRAGKTLFSLRVTVIPDCAQRLARFRLIDAKLSAYEQVLDRMPELAPPAEPQESIESVTWLIAFAGEAAHLQRWVELMLDVDQVVVAEIDT